MSQIAQQLIQDLKNQFPQELQKMDTNRDGTVSRDELVDCLLRCGVANWCSAQLMANEVFQALDRNHDGRLTYEEVHNNHECFVPHCHTLELDGPYNGINFRHFPRTTMLSWRPVACAAYYDVEVQFQDRCSWPVLFKRTVHDSFFTFDFVGAQPGRWQVTAFDSAAHQIAQSAWWEFRYLV